MGRIVVSEVDDDVIERHSRMAAAKGRSLEDHIRDLLSDEACFRRISALAAPAGTYAIATVEPRE